MHSILIFWIKDPLNFVYWTFVFTRHNERRLRVSLAGHSLKWKALQATNERRRQWEDEHQRSGNIEAEIRVLTRAKQRWDEERERERAKSLQTEFTGTRLEREVRCERAARAMSAKSSRSCGALYSFLVIAQRLPRAARGERSPVEAPLSPLTCTMYIRLANDPPAKNRLRRRTCDRWAEYTVLVIRCFSFQRF